MKRIIRHIYGMQYEELEQKGRDGNKARFNGNVLVAAYLVVILLLVLLLFTLVSTYNDTMTRIVHNMFGYWSGKSVGKLLAIPLFAFLYITVTLTIGSESSFREYVMEYKKLSPEEKKKSLRIVMTPFMVMLAAMVVIGFTRL